MGNKKKEEPAGYLEKRKVLYESEVSSDRLQALAEQFVQAGQLSDAVECYRKAGAVEQLEALVDEAVAQGDTFLCEQIASAIGRTLAEEQWAGVGKQAMEKGKYGYALRAFEMIGDEAAIQQVKKAMEPEEESES